MSIGVFSITANNCNGVFQNVVAQSLLGGPINIKFWRLK